MRDPRRKIRSAMMSAHFLPLKAGQFVREATQRSLLGCNSAVRGLPDPFALMQSPIFASSTISHISRDYLQRIADIKRGKGAEKASRLQNGNNIALQVRKVRAFRIEIERVLERVHCEDTCLMGQRAWVMVGRWCDLPPIKPVSHPNNCWG